MVSRSEGRLLYELDDEESEESYDEELDELVREYNKLCRENYEGDEKYFTIQKVTESANFDIKYVIEVGQPK